MASPLAALFDKRRAALTRARFKAWWDGAEFREDEALAANDAAGAVDSELFETPAPPLPARLQALAVLWGEGRIMPGDATSEALAPAQLGVGQEGLIAVLGPGLLQPVVTLADAHPGPIKAFEWRDETASALSAALTHANLGPRVTAARIDLETHHFEPDSVDGVLSLDEFTFADEPTRLAHHLAKMLKPGACLLVECYAGLPAADIAPSFASAFAEPHIRAAGDVAHYLLESGLKIEGQDDLTEECIDLARQGFKRVESRLLEGGSIDLAVARELGWEAEAWRARLRMLASRRLERRRIIARRPD